MGLAIVIQARNDAEQYEKRRVLMFDWVLKCSLQQPTCRRSASPSVGCKPSLSLPGWLTRYTVPGKAPYQKPLR
jgi:hypothetical protein